MKVIAQSIADFDSPAATRAAPAPTAPVPDIDSRAAISDLTWTRFAPVPQPQAQAIAPVRGQSVSRAVIARLPYDSRGVRRGLAVAMLFADDAAIGDAATNKLVIVVEEWLINVLEHGGAATNSRIVLRLQRLERAVRITISDAGRDFDPREVEYQGPNLVRGGGAGLELIKAWSRIVGYTRRAGRNRLVLEMPAP